MKRYAGRKLVSIKVNTDGRLSWLCIFHFAQCTTQDIKVPSENKVTGLASPLLGLPVSFFLCFSSGWSPGAQRPSEFTFLPGLLRPSREGALHLHPIERAPVASVNRVSPCRGFIGFLCKPRNINHFLSSMFLTVTFFISLYISLYLSHRRHHPEDTLDPTGAGPL